MPGGSTAPSRPIVNSSVGGFLKSDGGQALFGDYVEGESSFTEDAKTVLSALGSQGVKDLSLAAVVKELISKAEGEEKSHLVQLLQRFQQSGKLKADDPEGK